MHSPNVRAADSATLETLLAEARQGSREALARALEGCRQYLGVVARHGLPAKLQPRVSESELVQLAVTKAFENFASFRGNTEAEWLGWLRAILQNTLLNCVEYHTAGVRDINREVQPLGEDSSRGWRLDEPAAPGPSPSSVVRAEELDEALYAALARLPKKHREVVELYWREGLTFEEIGKRKGLTGDAIRKRWVEAIRRLRKMLEKSYGAD